MVVENALNMIASSTTPATGAVGEVRAHRAGLDRVVEHLLEQRHERRVGPGGLLGVRGHQLLRELGQRPARRLLAALRPLGVGRQSR